MLQFSPVWLWLPSLHRNSSWNIPLLNSKSSARLQFSSSLRNSSYSLEDLLPLAAVVPHLTFLLSCDCSFLILSVFILLSFRIPQGSPLFLSLFKFWWNLGFNLIIMEILMKPNAFFKKSNDFCFYGNDLCSLEYIFKHQGKIQRCKKNCPKSHHKEISNTNIWLAFF